MTTRALIGSALLLFLAGYGTGRYVQPARIETRTVTVDKVRLQAVEHRVEVQAKDRIINRVQTITKEGAVRTETQIVYRDRTTTVDDKAISKAEDRKADTTTVVTVQPRWTVGLGVGAALSLNPVGVSPSYMASVSYRLAGPFSVGAWATCQQANMQPTLGASVSLSW